MLKLGYVVHIKMGAYVKSSSNKVMIQNLIPL
jgi:hypothetical protein